MAFPWRILSQILTQFRIDRFILKWTNCYYYYYLGWNSKSTFLIKIKLHSTEEVKWSSALVNIYTEILWQDMQNWSVLSYSSQQNKCYTDQKKINNQSSVSSGKVGESPNSSSSFFQQMRTFKARTKAAPVKPSLFQVEITDGSE